MPLFKKTLNFILAIFFPNHCLYCEEIIAQNFLFCNICWSRLKLIDDPKCPICSYQYEVEIANMQPICANCIVKKPNYDSVITIFHYNYVIKKIISDFKYHDKLYISNKIAKILLPKINNIITKDDILIAVPLHYKKLQQRKFNQSLLICQELIRLLDNKPKLISNIIIRVKNTKIQAQLRKKERISNVKKAFIVKKKYYNLIKNKKIFLVDDVITTAATVENCAKKLKKKGAKEVIIVSLAKTIY